MQFFYTVITSSLLWLTPLLILHGASNHMRPIPPKEDGTAQKPIQVRLTTEIISERYCRESGSDTSDNLMMKLRLRYTNEGSGRLIFYKHDNAVLRHMISQYSTVSGRNGRYLVDLSLTTVTGGKDAMIDQPTPSSSFTILAPGDSFVADAELIVFVRRHGKGNEADGLLPGNYTLQIIVSTWPESVGLAEILSRRWQSIGVLWHGNVKSDPMRFKVENRPKMVNCPEP